MRNKCSIRQHILKLKNTISVQKTIKRNKVTNQVTRKCNERRMPSILHLKTHKNANHIQHVTIIH